MFPPACRCRDLKDLAAARRASRVRPAVGAARHRGAGVSARPKEGHAGNGSGQSRRTRRSRFQQANRRYLRPRSKDRRNGSRYTRHHTQDAARRPGRTAFVDGWQKRALMVGAIFCGRRLPAARPGRRITRLDHVLRAWVLGLMLTFGWSRRRTGTADGAVLLGRQVGTAAAPAAGSHDAAPCRSSSSTGRDRVFDEAALPLGAIHQSSDTAAALKAGIINEMQAHCHRLQAAHAEPRRRSRGSACSASPSGASTHGA